MPACERVNYNYAIREVEMPQTLHAPHFSFHLPKLSSSEVASVEFIASLAVVLALVVGLSIMFPMGRNNSSDDGTYLAQMQH